MKKLSKVEIDFCFMIFIYPFYLLLKNNLVKCLLKSEKN